jgi:poly-beta-1,6-N-acetyl-D-glucosamine synthase
MLIKTFFWVSFFIVFYTYLGYGLLIWLINRIKPAFYKTPVLINLDKFEPPVALVIPAYNEEAYIEDKIKNTLLLNYPKEKLHVYFVTDGSNDHSSGIIEKYPHIHLLHQPERRGKAAAMNRAVQLIKEPFIIFCDVNTELNTNCIEEMVKHYKNEKVGAVAGEKKIRQAINSKVASEGEGLYWRYESFLKKQDSEFNSVVGAAGELFSVRRELYQSIKEDVIIEDFVLSLSIAMKGYLVKYSPGAYATETASVTIKEEQKRKIRISAGGFQAMVILKGLLNIFRYGTLSFQYISHRVLRWSVTPVCLFLLLPLNFILVLRRIGMIYEVLLCVQLSFYLLALSGWLLKDSKLRLKLLYIPYYFLFMNISIFWGFKRFLTGKQSAMWDKAAREKPNK